jgi:hypothetical protein
MHPFHCSNAFAQSTFDRNLRSPLASMFSLVLSAVCFSVVAGGVGEAMAQATAQSAAASKIAAPASAKSLMRVAAIGVQIYKCALIDGKPTWTFVAPEADLFDAAGKLVGKHGAGPFWEMFDGSNVNGAVAAREDAPRPGAIPHLLLTTKSTGAASGAIAKVTAIQRVNTLGGVAPSTGCTMSDVDKMARVYYTADYVLFVDA